MAKIVLIAATLGLLECGNVVAAPADESDGQLLRGKAALGGWEQDKPGLRRQLTPKDLPPIGKSTPNFVEVVPMPAGAKPRVPAGFRLISPFNRRPAVPGARSTSAMSWATIPRSNMRPRSRRTRSTVGPGTTSETMRTRGIKVHVPT
jgi:hypothetical protein